MRISETQYNKMPKDLQVLFNKLPNPSRKEVTDLFPETGGGKYKKSGNRVGGKCEYSVGLNGRKDAPDNYGDKGSAARFFYCAKSSKKERDMGCGGLEEKHNPHGSHVGRDLTNPKVHLGGLQGGKARNNHPTVKPLALMKYLVTLITREGQTVLDPFLGSGTTGIAAKELKRDFIGIELSEEYMEIAKARICNNS